MLPKYHFDKNLKEVPVSIDDFNQFIAKCYTDLADKEIKDRRTILSYLGFALRVTKQFNEAKKIFKEALSLCSITDLNSIVNAKIRLAHVYQWERHYDVSNELFEEIELLYLNHELKNSIKGTYWQHRGKNEFDQKNFSVALAFFEKALNIRQADSTPIDQIESTQHAIAITKECLQPNVIIASKRQIIAIGGGGFSMEPDNCLLDQYVLQASNKTRPKICFIGTASGDALGYIDKFYTSFRRYDCEPTHLSLFKGNFADLRSFVLNQDIIYVGGGNTKNLLVLWKEWGLDRILYEAYLSGVILSGISAGAICWFEQMLTDSIPGQLSSLNGLGFLKGFCIPHFDGEADRKPSTLEAIESKNLISDGWGIDDGAALHYIDEKCFKVVCSHPEKKAYMFSSGNSCLSQESLYLGGKETLIRRAALEDAKPIHEAHMRSIQLVCAKDYSEVETKAWGNRPYDRAQREHAINNDLVWVVEKDGVIHGYGHLRLFEKDNLKQANILGLYLTPEVLGKKLGHRIVTLMTEQAKTYGATQINLESTISAHSFYGQNGFRDNGQMSTININNKMVRCFPMNLDLAAIKMQTGNLHHIEIYVSDLKQSIPFWSWLLLKLGYFEYQSWDQGKSYRKDDTYIVFVQTEEKYRDVTYHRCRTGLNHLAFHAASTEIVDQVTKELRAKNIKILYEDKHPHAGGASYGVYFEDPDRIKVELVAP